MPLYEYECPQCGLFAESQRITDPPLLWCITCGSKVKRLISRSSFALRGKGWYQSDYNPIKGDED